MYLQTDRKQKYVSPNRQKTEVCISNPTENRSMYLQTDRKKKYVSPNRQKTEVCISKPTKKQKYVSLNVNIEY